MSDSPKKGTIVPKSSRQFAEVPGTQDADVDYVRASAMEYATRTFPKVGICLLDRNKTKVDPLYRESQDKIHKDPLFTPMRVDSNPSQQKLLRYGVDQPRQLIVYPCIELLREAGVKLLGSTDLIGSVILFDSQEYEVMSQHRPNEGYWVQTNVAMFYALICQKYRKERQG